MKDSLNHALLMTTLLERDIARICASGTEAQQGLAADCAEHRRQLANKLRHIANMEDIATVIAAERKVTIIPSTPEQSAELHKLAERSREINATPSKLTELDEQSFKAGDFNDINEPDDDTYLRHAAVSDAKALAEYQKRVRRIGWILAGIAAVSAGVIIGGIKIWFTYFNL